jgi:hypothetical protein
MRLQGWCLRHAFVCVQAAFAHGRQCCWEQLRPVPAQGWARAVCRPVSPLKPLLAVAALLLLGAMLLACALACVHPGLVRWQDPPPEQNLIRCGHHRSVDSECPRRAAPQVRVDDLLEKADVAARRLQQRAQRAPRAVGRQLPLRLRLPTQAPHLGGRGQLARTGPDGIGCRDRCECIVGCGGQHCLVRLLGSADLSMNYVREGSVRRMAACKGLQLCPTAKRQSIQVRRADNGAARCRHLLRPFAGEGAGVWVEVAADGLWQSPGLVKPAAAASPQQGER